MTLRRLYFLGVYSTALQGTIYLVEGVNYFLLGQQVFTLPVFFPWFIFYNVILLMAAAVYAYYFNVKAFKVSFGAMLLNAVAGIVSFIIIAGVFRGRREWIALYTPAQIFLLTTTVVLALTFIFSRARRRFWLRISGIFLACSGIVILILTAVHANAPPDLASSLEGTAKWASLLSCIGPFLMMLNFLDEQQSLPAHTSEISTQNAVNTSISFLLFAAVLGTIFFAFKLTGETVARVSWEKDFIRKTANWNQVWKAQTFVGSNGDTLRYQFVEPERIDTTRTYPMVVCLPYSGGIEGSPAAEFLLKEENRRKYPAYLFVPFCPNGSGWGGIPNYPTMDTLVFESIEAVEREFSAINHDKVYVTGVSRGGYGSWHFISLRPDLFAAALPVCGGGDPKKAHAMSQVAIWAFHGEKDYNVPVAGSRDVIAAIKEYGGHPKYTEFEGYGHNIWHQVITTPGVFEWLFQQEKSASLE